MTNFKGIYDNLKFVMFGKEKILVEMYGASQLMRKKKCPVIGTLRNRVLIRKGKGVRGDPDVTAEFNDDCVVFYRNKLGLLKRKLVWKQGHKRCVSFWGKHVALSMPDPEGFFNSGVIRNAGSTVTTIKAPVFLYLAIGMVIVMQIVGFLVQSGRLIL